MGKCFLHGNGTDVERKSGSFTTSASGTATVQTGFKPDLLVFKLASYSDGGYQLNPVIALPFAEDSRNSLLAGAWETTSGGHVVFYNCSATANGFSFSGYIRGSDGVFYPIESYHITYTAVKYT